MLDTRFCGGPGLADLAHGGVVPDGVVERHGIPNDRWTWLRQVHGAAVVVVAEPGDHAGAAADAAVTATPGAVLAIRTADCAPVVVSDAAASVLGVAHVGWRGLVAGVLGATVESMRGLGASGPLTMFVEAHVRARCYEFGVDDLDAVAGRFGDAVRATTGWGTPALDLTAAIRAAAAEHGASVSVAPGCTACEPDRFFSHRARGDAGRHATVAWLS